MLDAFNREVRLDRPDRIGAAARESEPAGRIAGYDVIQMGSNVSAYCVDVAEERCESQMGHLRGSRCDELPGDCRDFDPIRSRMKRTIASGKRKSASTVMSRPTRRFGAFLP